MDRVGNDVAEVLDIARGRVVNNLDHLRKCCTVPGRLHSFSKLCSRKIAKPVDLVLDRDGKDLSMNDHRRRSCRPFLRGVGEAVEVVHHVLDNLWVVKSVIVGPFDIALSGRELDDATLALLSRISSQSLAPCWQAYLEGSSLEGGLEVSRPCAENDLVGVKLVRSADDLAVRELLGTADSGTAVSLVEQISIRNISLPCKTGFELVERVGHVCDWTAYVDE